MINVQNVARFGHIMKIIKRLVTGLVDPVVAC